MFMFCGMVTSHIHRLKGKVNTQCMTLTLRTPSARGCVITYCVHVAWYCLFEVYSTRCLRYTSTCLKTYGVTNYKAELIAHHSTCIIVLGLLQYQVFPFSWKGDSQYLWLSSSVRSTLHLLMQCSTCNLFYFAYTCYIFLTRIRNYDRIHSLHFYV